MNATVIVVVLMVAWLSGLGVQIARILKSGRAPSLIRVGHTPVGPDLERAANPVLYWFSVTVMTLVWLVSLGALAKYLFF